MRWSFELRGTSRGLDHLLPGNLHYVPYCFCISYADAVATRQRSNRSFAALRASYSYQLPSLLGMLFPLAYLSPHFPSQTRRCLLRPMSANSMPPPLYLGEIQPATFYRFEWQRLPCFKEQAPGTSGWLVGCHRGAEMRPGRGLGRLSVQGRGLLLGNMGPISSFVAVVLETPMPTTQ